MILCARRYRCDQCRGGIPACCASVLYMVKEGIRELRERKHVGEIVGILIVLVFL